MVSGTFTALHQKYVVNGLGAFTRTTVRMPLLYIHQSTIIASAKTIRFLAIFGLVSFILISRNADLFRLPATLFLYRLILCQYVKELFSCEQSQSISLCPLFHPLCKDYLLSHPRNRRMRGSPSSVYCSFQFSFS